MSLDRRRLDERRMKVKAFQKEKLNRSDSSLTIKDVGKNASVHGASCSCMMCGNPRKHFNEKTLSEKSEDETWNNDFEDIEE